MGAEPNDRIYTQDHVWLKTFSDGTYELGITSYAQQELGDIVFVDLPSVGTSTQPGQACAIVESVKSASDIICPVEGVVSQVNQQLADEPELINESPYTEGWILRIKMDQDNTIENKMSADEYVAQLSASTV